MKSDSGKRHPGTAPNSKILLNGVKHARVFAVLMLKMTFNISHIVNNCLQLLYKRICAENDMFFVLKPNVFCPV